MEKKVRAKITVIFLKDDTIEYDFFQLNVLIELKRNGVFATNFDFLTPISFHPNVVHHRYFKV